MSTQGTVLSSLFHKDNLVDLVKALDVRNDKLSEDLSWVDSREIALPMEREMKLNCAVLGLLRETYGSSAIDDILRPTLLDSEQQPMIPGRCYCLASYADDTGGELTYGSLAWFGSDGKLYDANYESSEGEILDEVYDVLVLQAGGINPDYLNL